MSDPRYLLDTNILSDLIKNPAGEIANQIEIVGESAICTSVMVAAELRFGAFKRGSTQLAERVDLILSLVQIEAILPPFDQHYAEIRGQLEESGKPIGPNDLVIAAHGRCLDLTVVTANESEFRRIDGLRVENWLR